MARKKKNEGDEVDWKSAAAGDGMDPMQGGASETAGAGADEVFDGPLDAEQAIEELIALNHARMECSRRWEDAKAEASDAKKELDNASNAISLLIDRIDRQMNGAGADQPFLKTLGGNAEATV